MRTLGIIALILQLAMPSLPAWAAKCTTTATPMSWSDNSKWSAPCSGSGVPGFGAFVNYSAIVAAGHSATINDTRTIYATNVDGSLTLMGDTTLAGPLNVGNGSSKNGTLTFGPYTLALGVNNLNLGNSFLRTSGTDATHWAKVTGTGSIGANGSVYGGLGNMDIVLSYLSLQNTGTVEFRVTNGGGSGQTIQFKANHVVVNGPSSLIIGSGIAGSGTPLTAPVTIDNSDFITVPITFKGLTGAPDPAIYYVKNSLFWNTSGAASTVLLDTLNRSPLTLDGCAFANYAVTATLGTDYPIIRNSLIAANLPTDGLSLLISGGDRGRRIVENTVFYNNGVNTHLVSDGYYTALPSGSPHYIVGNIFDSRDAGSECIIPGRRAYTIKNNIFLGLNGGGDPITFGLGTDNVVYTTGSYDISNNTTVFDPLNNNQGLLFYAAHGVPLPNTGESITLKNNLIAPSSGTHSALDYVIENGTGNTTNSIVISSYNNNNEWNTPSRSSARVTINSTANNIAVDPMFAIQLHRDVSEYYKMATGDTTFTDAEFWAELKKINGLDSATKTQTGAVTALSIPAMYSWIQAAYVPTNPALLAAGEGGTYIGAVQPVAAAPPSIWQRIFKSRIFH